MDILTYINKMNRLYGSEQQVASAPYGSSQTYGAPEEVPMPNIQDLIREEGVQVGQQVKDGGRIGFKHGGSWADWMSNHSDQMTFEEYLQIDMDKPVHPINKSAGGRIYDTRKYFKPGGLVEPGVTHYGKKTTRRQSLDPIYKSAGTVKVLPNGSAIFTIGSYGYPNYRFKTFSASEHKNPGAAAEKYRKEYIASGKHIPGSRSHGKYEAGAGQKVADAYEAYVKKAFESGNMSKTKSLWQWLISRMKGSKERAHNILGMMKYQRVPFAARGEERFDHPLNVYRNRLIRKYVDEHNTSPKFLYSQEDIIRKTIGSGKKEYYTTGVQRSESFGKLRWLDKDIPPLDTKGDKVTKAVNHLFTENPNLTLTGKKIGALDKSGAGVFTKFIGERSGVPTPRLITQAIQKHPWYKENKNLWKYLVKTRATKDLQGKTFNEIVNYIEKARGGRIQFLNGITGFKRYTPEDFIYQSAIRHWHNNNFVGDKSRIEFYKKGSKTPVKWEDIKPDNRGVKRLKGSQVEFTFDGKPQRWNHTTLITKGLESGLFKDVYKAQNTFAELRATKVTNPNNPSGPKILLGELIEDVRGIKGPLHLDHMIEYGGVSKEPFKKLRVLSQEMNVALGNVVNQGGSKKLKLLMANEILGPELASKKGEAFKTALVNNQVSRMTDIVEGRADPLKIYDRATLNVLKKRQTGALTLVKSDVNRLITTLTRAKPEIQIQIAKELKCPLGDIAAASGGRIGFAVGSGTINCITSKLEADPKGTLSKIAQAVPEIRAPLAQTLGPDGWRFLGIDYTPSVSKTTQFIGEGVTKLPKPVGSALKMGYGAGRWLLADPFFFPLIPVELAVTGAYGFEKNKDEIMKSLKDNPFVSEMAKKYNMSAEDVRNAVLEKYRRAALNADAGLEEQMAFEPKHQKAVETFDKEFYPFWDPESYKGKPHADTSFVKDPAYGTMTGNIFLGMRQKSEEEERKLRSGEVGGTQFYKKPTYYTKKDYYPEDYSDEKLAGQIKSAKRIRFENLRGLEDPLPEGGFYEGGRVPFGKGRLVDEGRRKFMQWLAGITGAGIAAGTGLLKWGAKKGAGKTVIKAGDHIIQGTPGMPDWFIPLINRIVKEGDDVSKKLATVEREIVHTKKIGKGEEVTVYQDMNTGNVRVVYESPHNMGEAPVQLEYRAGEVIEEGTMKGKKTKPEFEAAEIEPVGRQVGPDDAEIAWDGENVVGKVEDLTSDTNKLKQFATKKKPTLKEIVKSQKKKKEVEYYKTSEGEGEYVVNKQGEGPIDGDEMFDEFGNYIGD